MMLRRSFIKAAAATPLAALPALASSYDDEAFLNHLIAIADHTGLSMDDLYPLLRDLPNEVTAQIAHKAMTVPARRRARANSQVAHNTKLLSLFREWEAIDEYRNTVASDDERDALCGTAADFERRIVKEPTTSVFDLAAKIVAVTHYGESDFDCPTGRKVIAEISFLVSQGVAT